MKRNCIRRPTLLFASPTTKTSQPSLPLQKMRARPPKKASVGAAASPSPTKNACAAAVVVVVAAAFPTTLTGRRAKRRRQPIGCFPYHFNGPAVASPTKNACARQLKGRVLPLPKRSRGGKDLGVVVGLPFHYPYFFLGVVVSLSL